jgi:phospholipid/cholesterol/gamma-HCH transport system ATP-binding protein
MYQIEQLEMSFQKNHVLRGVSFSLPKASCVGLIGPSGSGKSVLLKILAGILTPDSGAINTTGSASTTNQQVGFLFQEGALFDSMTVLENVTFPLLQGFPGQHSESNPRCSYDEAVERGYAVLKQVGLASSYEKFPGQLSGGMRRRLGLARAIVHKPNLVLLDDPTAGLDPVAANVIMDLIAALFAEYRPTLLIVSHDLRRLLPRVERVLALFDGKLVGDYPVSQLESQSAPHVKTFIETRFDFSSLHEIQT